jgi:pyruvate/2-oxoglutarate/acetoin dehydrogenase E1 component
MATKKYANAVRDVIDEEMKRDSRVFIMGEDIGIQGGVFGCTKGLYAKYGSQRVRDTPISEQAIVGAAVGASLVGMRPIVELMYIDFALICMEEIIDLAAKMHFLYGKEVSVPLVIRGQQGAGRGNGVTHSQSIEAVFMHFPGLKVAMPSTPADAAGLLRTAIRDDNPVVFIEHKGLYNTVGEVPEDPEYAIPFGQAVTRVKGDDLTIIATSAMVQKAIQAAAELAVHGIHAEVIDLRSLVPLDEGAIVESAQRTGRVICVHESHMRCGVGAEIASIVQERAFQRLKSPVVRLGARQNPIAFNLGIENATIPQVSDIIRSAKELIQDKQKREVL